MKVASRIELHNTMKSSRHVVLGAIPPRRLTHVAVVTCGLHSMTSKAICGSSCLVLCRPTTVPKPLCVSHLDGQASILEEGEVQVLLQSGET